MDAGKRIRTSEGTKPMRLERIPFDRSGIPALKKTDRKFYKSTILTRYEDGHSGWETPDLIPNSEVKPVTSVCCSLRQEAKQGCCLRFFIRIGNLVKSKLSYFYMFKYNRIWIVGGSGSGKTYLAKRLSELLKINNYELDDILWVKKWTIQRSKFLMMKKLKEIVAKRKWIIDGISSSWIEPGIKKADLVILLHVPARTIIWRLFLRHLKCRIKGLSEKWNDFIKLTKFSIAYKKGNATSLRHRKLIKKHSLKVVVIQNKRSYNKLIIDIIK